MAQLETGRESRQGKKGKPALYVLIASVVLAVIAGAVVLGWQNQTAPADPASRSQDAARGTVTDSKDPAKQGSPADPVAAPPNGR